MRSALLSLVALLAAVPAGAQIIRLPRATEPAAWASFGIGLLQAQTVVDGSTGSSWEFGSGLQWRASLEKSSGNGVSYGLTGTLAHMPLRYDGATCLCDAHATVWQALGSVHVGGGNGFHQVIELYAGVVGYGNFREDGSDVRLPPDGTDLDLSFGVGYGFGYQASSHLQLILVQDYAASLHQRTNLPGNASALSQQYITRLGVRLGLGQRRPY